MAALAYAGAPAVLWPWAMSQYEHIRHFISTEAIQPPMSPFMLAHPEAGPANLSWAKPLFCDVTVHLPSRDSQGKLAYTGSDGCYLGRASSVGTSRRLVRSVPCRKQDSQFDVVSLLLLTLRLSRRQSSRSSFATRLPKMPTSTEILAAVKPCGRPSEICCSDCYGSRRCDQKGGRRAFFMHAEEGGRRAGFFKHAEEGGRRVRERARYQ